MMQSKIGDTGRQTGEVLYPYAYSEEEKAEIHIDGAPHEGGRRYSCVHCHDRMIAVVQVKQKAPHFRHFSEPCEPDRYLHAAAISIIQKAHSEAVERGDSYKFTRPCGSCAAFATEIDLADGWMCGKPDTSVVKGTRSDLHFTHLDERLIVVEVVVTHDMEPQTEAAYENAGIPIAIIRPTLESLDYLRDGLHIVESLNFKSEMCGRCEERGRRVWEEQESSRVVKIWKAIEEVQSLAAEGYSIEEIQTLTKPTTETLTGYSSGWSWESILHVVDAETRERLLSGS